MSSPGRNAKSIKTRIETKYCLPYGKVQTQVAMQNPSKQGLKLNHPVLRRRRLLVAMQNPSKQGLKPDSIIPTAAIINIVAMQNPSKQGLKLFLVYFYHIGYICRNAKSIKTRIETYLYIHIHHY